jgi:hypothetical protein
MKALFLILMTVCMFGCADFQKDEDFVPFNERRSKVTLYTDDGVEIKSWEAVGSVRRWDGYISFDTEEVKGIVVYGEMMIIEPIELDEW